MSLVNEVATFIQIVDDLLEDGEFEALHSLLALQEKSHDGVLRPKFYVLGEKAEKAHEFPKKERRQTGIYTDGIKKTWRAVEREWHNAAPARQNAKIVGLQVRYAGIVAAVGSISTKVPIEMTPALIKANVWTPEQGIESALQASDERQRIELLRRLVKLDCITTDPLRARVLDFIETLSTAALIADAYISIVPSFPWKEKHIALVRILKRIAENREDRAILLRVVRDLYPYLPKGTIKIDNQQVFRNIFFDLSDEIHPATLIGAVVQHVGSNQEDVLSVIAPDLPHDVLINFIQRVENGRIYMSWGTDHEECLTNMIVALARMDGDIETVKSLLRRRKPEWQAVGLARILEHVDEASRHSLYHEFLDTVLMTPRGSAYIPQGKPSASSSVSYDLENKALRNHPVRAVVQYCFALPDEIYLQAVSGLVYQYDPIDGAWVFPEIVQKLTEARREQLFDVLLERFETDRRDDFGNVHRRKKGLLALVPLLPQSTLPRALAISEGLLQETEDDLGWIEDNFREEWNTIQLDTLADKSMSAADLVRPLFGEFDNADVEEVAEIIIAIVQRNSQQLIEAALPVIEMISNDLNRLNVLSQLAQHLPAPVLQDTHFLCSKLVDDELAQDSATSNAHRLALAQARLARQLEKEVQNEALTHAVRLVERISNVASRADALAGVANLVRESETDDGFIKDLFLEALIARQRLDDGEEMVRAMVKLVKYADVTTQRSILPQLLLLVNEAFPCTGNRSLFGIALQEERNVVLAELIPLFALHSHNECLIDVLPDIDIMEGEQQLEMLGMIVSQFGDSFRQDFTRVRGVNLPEDPLSDIRHQQAQIDTLAAQLSSDDEVFAQWCDTLREMATGSRKEFYDRLTDQIEVMLALAGREAVSEALLAINTIGKWWL